MRTLDELVARQKEYEAEIAACSHAFTDWTLNSAELGKCCTKCGVYELPWLRREVTRLQGAVMAERDDMVAWLNRLGNPKRCGAHGKYARLLARRVELREHVGEVQRGRELELRRKLGSGVR